MSREPTARAPGPSGPLRALLDQPSLEAWGERIGGAVALPAVLCLSGPLGAGKSVLARAVARGAGVRGPVPSPTFNLLLAYDGARGPEREPVSVVHLDLLRLEDPEEVWELGWRELPEPGQIVLIEWPERAGDLLPADRWDISLRPPPGRPEVREVEARATGSPPGLPPVETST